MGESTSSGSSRSASTSRSTRTRQSSAPPPSRASCSCTAARKASARRASRSCSTARIELDRYSTFALPDFEKEEGWTLLCRAHAYSDLEIELINYDEEMIRSGLPIQRAETVVVSVEPVTPDIRHLELELVEPREIKFLPGQYVDIAIPGTDEHALVLDGQHLEPGQRPARVHDQGLSRTGGSRTFWTPG